MRHTQWIVFALVGFAGCAEEADSPEASQPVAAATGLKTPVKKPSLADARRGFLTKLVPSQHPATAVPEPPPEVFRLVKFDSPIGKLAAYLSLDPGDSRKHPAIIWITGGDCNSIDDVWTEVPRDNDQTAAAYRRAGIVMMFPTLRGGNQNPGKREGFLGEVDDVLAAVDYLARQPYVDPARIYLGGHSTGGTLVMLVAESTDRFRAVFSFGPADDVSGYGPQYLPFDTSNPREAELRSPGRWLHSVRSPLFVFEGTVPSSNIDSLETMARASKNRLAHFLPVSGFNHFDILAPTNELIASKILKDDGPKTNFTVSKDELAQLRRK